jgi:hypothetical protein
MRQGLCRYFIPSLHLRSISRLQHDWLALALH